MATITNPKEVLVRVPRDATGQLIQGPLRPLLAHHTAFNSALSGLCTRLTSGITVVELVATQNCHYVLLGDSGLCTVNDPFLPAGIPVKVNVRDAYFIACTGPVGGTAGILHINELT